MRSATPLPVSITHADDHSGRLYIVGQQGQIRILQNGALHATPFLDVTHLISCCGERGLLGEKTGQGFYKRQKSDSGESEILVLDPGTLEYRPRRRPQLPAIEAAQSIEDAAQRVRALDRNTRGGSTASFAL